MVLPSNRLGLSPMPTSSDSWMPTAPAIRSFSAISRKRSWRREPTSLSAADSTTTRKCRWFAGQVTFLFAGLLSLLSGQWVRDTASGMRIVRRDAYTRLRPLPAGLHFTPAMSARALLDREARVKLIEIDMPYHERIGESKLKVGKDGLRFLNVITKTAIQYRPARVATILGITFAIAGGIATALARRSSRSTGTA